MQDTGRPFDIVVIDEAAQAVEPSTLIPLRYGATQVVLVGDPQQLPATVLSRTAARAGYDRSLFARLAAGGQPCHMLSVQYRSHPEVSRFPSAAFYGGLLTDGECVRGAGRALPLHAVRAFRPLVFFDLRGRGMAQGTGPLGGGPGSGAGGGGGAGGGSAGAGSGGRRARAPREGATASSLRNEDEAEWVVRLLGALQRWRGPPEAGAAGSTGTKFSGTVGVITFYRAQLLHIRRRIGEAFGPGALREPGQPQAAQQGAAEAHAGQPGAGAGAAAPAAPPLRFTLDVNTVDGFQGQERDVVILSCVRTAQAGGGAGGSGGASAGGQALGFLADPRRQNVALTRAKYACWVVGDGRALDTPAAPAWQGFVRHCRDTGAVVRLDGPHYDPLALDGHD